MNFLFGSGELKENCRRISWRILMAKFSHRFLGLVLPGFQAPPPPTKKKSRPKFFSNFTFLNPKFAHAGFLLRARLSVVCRRRTVSKEALRYERPRSRILSHGVLAVKSREDLRQDPTTMIATGACDNTCDMLGDRLNTVSESTVSKKELSESCGPHRVPDERTH